jgi:hypothetical protein
MGLSTHPVIVKLDKLWPVLDGLEMAPNNQWLSGWFFKIYVCGTKKSNKQFCTGQITVYKTAGYFMKTS